MASTPASSRRARRILQACENCRRKKTRCPGERPRCSNCTRLGQSCRYPAAEFQNIPGSDPDPPSATADQSSYIRRLEDRLARLEDKLESALDKSPDKPGGAGVLPASPRQGETPQSTFALDGPHSPAHTALPSSSTPGITGPTFRASFSHLLPPTPVIEEAIRVYFRCCRRQPVWLFEPPSCLSPSCPEAILLCVLALAVQYAPDSFAAFPDEPLQNPSTYNDAARSMILLQVANSTVDLATLQALCLLAFSNLVCGDLQLASFHIALVGNLLQFSGLDTHMSPERTPFLECQRRLFWSVQTVRVLCGHPIKIPSTYDIKAPCFVAPQETWRRKAHTSEQAPLLPLDLQNDSGERSMSIWLHMVRSASLWGLVRVYVWRCCHGQTRAPWQPDSDYTAINAQLFDMECAFPTSFRYDSANFVERPLDELLKHRDFWLPWMKIQVTYHTIHSVLNHPFLYSPRVSRPRPGPNAFWKTSTDQALLHSTWIARLISMCQKKGLPLSDPFFGYSAAVAITLHLYWSRVADQSIRAAAEKYIAVCRSFIGSLAARWPVCRNMEKDVDKLIQLSSARARQQHQQTGTGTGTGADRSTSIPPSTTPTTMADNISLILWRILDFAAMQQPNTPLGQSLFQPPLAADLQPPPAANGVDQMDLQDPEVESPPDDFQTSLGAYASAPDWFSPPGTTNTNTGATNNVSKEPSMTNAPTIVAPATAPPVEATHHHMDDLSNWNWDTQPSDAAMMYDPFAQLFNRTTGPDPRWWDGGNL